MDGEFMFISETLRINQKKHLEIGGCDCVDLAKKFGTPLYVMDENLIRNNCRLYKNSIDKYYNGNGMILYAGKAFCSLALCKIAEQEGLGMDIVSGGELYTAIKAGFPMDRVYFHGNNKTFEEIEMAIENKIKRIVIDNREELYNINKIAEKMNRTAKVSFRIKPGIEAHTHEFIQTGQIDSKFGTAVENGEALNIIEEAVQLNNICVKGLHCHIGSQIFDLEPFKLAAKVMMDFAAELKEKFGIIIEELNLGGGFGIKYVPGDDPVEYDKYIQSISEVIKKTCNERGMKVPFVLMEPGRSITGPAGITLYTVGSVKDIEGVRKYISVDGGMTDNPRYALYQAKYDALLANKPCPEKVEKVTIAGKCCESGDLIAKDIFMPEAQKGDIIVVMATGAYNYSMASNYNRIPKPPVILVKEGNARVIVRGEDFEDMIRNDIIPENL